MEIDWRRQHIAARRVVIDPFGWRRSTWSC